MYDICLLFLLVTIGCGLFLKDEVEKYLQQESHNAAIQIQRHWRGYKVRKDIIEEKRRLVIQTRAAVVIQRKVTNCSYQCSFPGKNVFKG